MKNLRNLSTILIALLFISSCEANDDRNDSPNTEAKGVITLTGDDTADVGNTLNVGAIAYGRKDVTGIEESLIIAPVGSVISDDSPTLSPNDPGYVGSIINFKDNKNTFVIVATKELISMIIVTNGVERRYICDSKFNTSVSCGAITLDAPTRKVVFNNTTVKNVDSGTILTLNGELTWN